MPDQDTTMYTSIRHVARGETTSQGAPYVRTWQPHLRIGGKKVSLRGTIKQTGRAHASVMSIDALALRAQQFVRVYETLHPAFRVTLASPLHIVSRMQTPSTRIPRDTQTLLHRALRHQDPARPCLTLHTILVRRCVARLPIENRPPGRGTPRADAPSHALSVSGRLLPSAELVEHALSRCEK